MPVNILSKSKFQLGLQCPKLLYLSSKQPKVSGALSPALQALFDLGDRVGKVAQEQYPKGVLIRDGHRNPEQAIKDTAQAIAEGALTLFEATFSFDGVLVQVDILNRKSKKAAWDLIEVKASSDVKAHNISDVAVQNWVLKANGLDVRRQFVMHINRECTYPDLSDLIIQDEVTDEVAEFYFIQERVTVFKKVLAQKKSPTIAIGPQCDSPRECPFKSKCWKDVPVPGVFNIPKLSGDLKWQYFNEGRGALNRVPRGRLKPAQLRMIDHTLSGKLFCDSMKVKELLKTWKYPLSFFDFETINPAIPRYKGATPYAQTPFQFSCHVWVYTFQT